MHFAGSIVRSRPNALMGMPKRRFGVARALLAIRARNFRGSGDLRMTRDAQFQLSNATSVPHRAEAHQVISSSPAFSSHRAEAHQVIARVSEELGGMPRDFHVVDGEAAIRAPGPQRRAVPLPVTLARSPTRIRPARFRSRWSDRPRSDIRAAHFERDMIIRLEGQPALFMHRRIGRPREGLQVSEVPHHGPRRRAGVLDLLQAHPALRDEWTENHNFETTRASRPSDVSCGSPASTSCRSYGMSFAER